MRNRWLSVVTFALFAVMILGASATSALAAPPANDAFASAVDLGTATAGSTSPGVANNEATLQATEVAPDGESASLWYKWRAPATDLVSFGTDGSYDPLVGPSEAIATKVRVYRGLPTAATFPEVSLNYHSSDLLPANYPDHVVFPVVAGQDYYIAITSPPGAIKGMTQLKWQTKGYTGHITGKLTATNGGANLAGIQVDAYLIGGAGSTLRTTSTLADGTYDLAGLGAGNYQVQFTDVSVAKTYLEEWWNNAPTQSKATPVTLATNSSTASAKNATLARASSISGTVRNNGTAMAGVTVQLYSYSNGVYDSNSPTAYTNASGVYTFTGVTPKSGAAGNHYIVHFVEPFASGLPPQYYNQKTSIDLAEKLPMPEGTIMSGVDCTWPISNPGALSGTVTVSGGAPVQGVTVTLSGGGGSTTTAANGTYAFAGVTAGTYSVTYSKTDYVEQTIPGIVITGGATTTRNVTMVAVPSPGTLSGTVSASGVGPLAGVSVTVGSLAPQVTGAGGTYSVTGLAPGAYTVTYSASGYVEQTISNIAITAGATTTRNVTMEAVPNPGTLSGIVGASGAPLGGVSVKVGSLAPLATAADGAYSVPGLAPGTYTVVYSKAGYVEQSISGITVTAGATTTRNVTMVALPAATLLPVYRFYNKKNGSHFYTASEAERQTVQTTLASIYSLDGVAYSVNTSNPANNAPLYRFYNKKNGSHFYTSSLAEKNSVQTNLSAIYSYDGPAYNVCVAPPAGSQTVFRFYNKKNGSHFYTASEAEKNNVISKLSAIYALDGPAFYVAP